MAYCERCRPRGYMQAPVNERHDAHSVRCQECGQVIEQDEWRPPVDLGDPIED